MRTVKLEHNYSAPAAELWTIATDYDALNELMKGIASFEGLPSGRTKTGQKMSVLVSLFGILPKQSYFIEVLECDDVGMVLRSSERGAGVKSWHHTMTVTETATGCRLTDRIEIDAGVLTFAFAKWAQYLYSARHKPRQRMLKDRGQGRFDASRRTTP